MKYLRSLMAIAFIILGLAITSNAYAFEKGEHKDWKQGRQKIWDQLNLTDVQKKQLEDNKSKNKEQMKATFEKMKSYRESLNAELMKPQLDMNKINAIQAEVKALEAQMTDNRLNSILEVRKILSSEQFEKFLSITGKHGQWRHKEGKKDEGACNEKAKI